MQKHSHTFLLAFQMGMKHAYSTDKRCVNWVLLTTRKFRRTVMWLADTMARNVLTGKACPRYPLSSGPGNKNLETEGV